MGTAFIKFCNPEWEEKEDGCQEEKTLEIGRIVFRAIIEAMQSQRPNDEDWLGYLDGAYGIKFLYIGRRPGKNHIDVGPEFLKAVRYIREHGPPDYYPKKDLSLLYDQLNLLEQEYLEIRGQSPA